VAVVVVVVVVVVIVVVVVVVVVKLTSKPLFPVLLLLPPPSESLMERLDRGHYLLSYLTQQPETHIAVVSHGDFLFTLFEQGR